MNFNGFCNTYDGKGIEDAGGYTSTEFNNFVRDFKSACRLAFPKDEYELKISSGHYFVSGFIRKDDKYVYISYDVPRGEYPMNFTDRSARGGALYRRVSSFKDYRGERNYFTDMYHFADDVKTLLVR